MSFSVRTQGGPWFWEEDRGAQLTGAIGFHGHLMQELTLLEQTYLVFSVRLQVPLCV